MPEILHNLSLSEFKTQLSTLPKDHIIVVRFTAEWCGPCQTINGECDHFFANCNDKIIPIVIDIEESIDLYVAMKRYKMINGIPVLFAYYGNGLQEQWYVPNASVVGGNKNNLIQFFNQCTMHVTKS